MAGLRVGNSSDENLKSGVTVVLCDEPAVAAVEVMGGAPGTRETDLLAPHNAVEAVNAITLSGGSAFGLDAASGVQAALRENKVGFEIGPHHIPIVPAAIIFDLINGGNKDWGRYPPYRELGYEAARNARTEFKLGNEGAGTGCTVHRLKGGLGTASAVLPDGTTVAALVVVNAKGSVTVGETKHFWAAPFEIENEFGGLGLPAPMPKDASELKVKFPEPGSSVENTTIAVIATDANLTKAETKRLAVSAHDGFARAIWPAHTPFDGDLVFGLATTKRMERTPPGQFLDLCAAASSVMARAIARGVYEATPAENDIFPCWSQLPD